MKNIISLLLFTFVFLVACRKEKIEEQSAEQSVIGKWETTSLRYQQFTDNQLETDTTINAPYANFLDPIVSLEFTSDSIHISLRDFTISYKYQRVGTAIQATEGNETYTLFTFSNLTAQSFDFEATEENADQNPPERYVYRYRSVRK